MTSTFTQELAGRLEAARLGQGLTNKELADRTGISPRMVKAKLAGQRPITSGEIYKLAIALGTTPSVVCEGF